LKRADTEYFSHQKLLHLLAESELWSQCSANIFHRHPANRAIKLTIQGIRIS
jgi:hypothetical protein